jgi:hypothetical protein
MAKYTRDLQSYACVDMQINVFVLKQNIVTTNAITLQNGLEQGIQIS